MPDTIQIFDTTLRDGEQTPGVSLTPEKKLEIAHSLDALGVDIIEAGFPITSQGEIKAIKMIANEGLTAEICGLARTLKQDIDRCLACDVDRIHTFIATSDIHMEHKLKKTSEQVLEQAVSAIEYAKEHGITVEFSAEDATRTRIDFLLEIFQAVTEAGADVLNIPDTVGVAIPQAMTWLVDQVRSVTDAKISVHCHDDLGLAVANSLAAIEAGAEQVHCCINGVGERAGNAALEEVAVALQFMYNVETQLDLTRLCETSRLVSRVMGVPLAPNKAIVGKNAFSHESGIHTHGIIASPLTYEPIAPELVGAHRKLVAGKHCGGHGVKEILKTMGIIPNQEQLKLIVKKIKALGDKGIRITDTDIRAIANTALVSTPLEEKVLHLEELLVVTGTNASPTATIRLAVNGKPYIYAENGVGPIDAAINAVQKACEAAGKFSLQEFRIEAITDGTAAVAETIVTIEDDQGRRTSARGVSEDIVTSGVEAIIEAINHLLESS